jgi:hypothetical protein
MRRIHYSIAAILITIRIGVAAAAEPSPATEITFNKHIAPIVFQQCAGCHHAGEVAPFPLLSYEDVRKRAKQIATVTNDRYMPPWKAIPGHGQFVGERRLKQTEVDLIHQWAGQGAKEGDARDLPPVPQFRDGWKLGQPDIVITMPDPYTIPADGPDIYRNFVFDVTVPEGKYLKAAEYRPGNRRVVHHAALALDMDGKARKQDEADPEPGSKGSLTIPGQLLPGSLSVWAPGRDPMPLPDGLSMPWKVGVGLILQLHLHPSGKPETEQSSIGLYLTDEPPHRAMADMTLIARKIDIPPGEKEYRSRDEFTLPIEMEMLGIFPHMHLIGREFKVTAQPPGKEPFSLLWINDWDFKWQSFYQCSAPVKLPAGTQIVLETIHDNSADNVRNPNNPPQRVTFGEQTTNEMSVAILQLMPAADADMPKLFAEQRKRILGAITSPTGPQNPSVSR